MKDIPDDQTDDRTTATNESAADETILSDEHWEVAAQAPYDPAETGGLTTSIILAVADAEGVSPRDIKHPPLFDVVDTAALEEALFGTDAGPRMSQCSTEFMYRGYRIAIQTDGWVLVHESTDT